ncbi:MAG: MBL fold metallo-hydrolase [Bacteroidia bacterium]|nr:MBL fold metallo-hydrolase [Bacteroidia bacterium]
METCNETKLTFLGTGTSQGIPVIGCHCPVCSSSDQKDKRLRSSALIEHHGLKILIDAGPDFRQQLLREGVDNLDAILITHEHKDHTGGLDDVRAINFLTKKALPIYCEDRVKKSLEMEYSYAFSEYKYPGAPEFDIRVIDENPFEVVSRSDPSKRVSVIPIRVLHYKLPILGYRINNIAYITDANRVDESELAKLRGLDVLVVNTVRKQRHISHFSLNEAIAFAQLVGAKRSFLTHLSHQMPVYSELEKELPEGINQAYDGLTLNILQI